MGRVAAVNTVPVSFLKVHEETAPPPLVIGKKLDLYSPTGAVTSSELPLEIASEGAPSM